MWAPQGDVKCAQRLWGFRGCGLFQEAQTEEKGILGEHSKTCQLAAGVVLTFRACRRQWETIMGLN